MTEKTQTEKLKERIKLYATGACIYQDGNYPCPINFETNDEICLDCLLGWTSKEAGWKPPEDIPDHELTGDDERY